MQVGEYRLKNPHDIETPEFLVYEDMVGYNIDAVIRVCGSVDRIVPHAKTHKSAAVLKRQMDAGLRSFKVATLREADLLVEHGVDELIFAYPLVHPKKIERLARLKRDNPDTIVRAIVSTPEHLEGLSAAMQHEGMTMEVYVDLDTGMRRTGVQPGAEAADFYAMPRRGLPESACSACTSSTATPSTSPTTTSARPWSTRASSTCARSGTGWRPRASR